jgi:tRNA(Ile)-lysidine synthase
VRTAETQQVLVAEADSLFSGLEKLPAILLAVSGGPDSTALLMLAARWRDGRKSGPKLFAVTVDHGLRMEAKREAAAVAKLARKLGVAHRIVRWTGKKPKTGLPQAARFARYRLLAEAARKAGAPCIVTAHTLDDQAETVLIRMSRGSGVTGLAAMARITGVPGGEGVRLVRPLLDIPKARLVATLQAAKIAFADDPTNRDPRFTRARLRGLMPQLAQEGLDARRLALLARRLKRAEAAIETAVDEAMGQLSAGSGEAGVIVFDTVGFRRLPAEIALRLTGRALGLLGDEGPVELGKLESLMAALDVALNGGQTAGKAGFRRSLAGAMVTLAADTLIVEPAPPRRGKSLTTRRGGSARRAKPR